MTTRPSHNQVLSPDAVSMARYCDVLFGYLDGYVPTRLISESGTPVQKPLSLFFRNSELPEALEKLAYSAATGSRGVFVVPGTVATQGQARAADINATGVLVIDLDDGDIPAKRDHLAKDLGVPTLEVASGGKTSDGLDKMHLYWRLTEPAIGEALEQVRFLRGEIAMKVGGDPAFKSLHQPIRVAGTIHGKSGRRSMVRIIKDSRKEYELGDLVSAVNDMTPCVAVTDKSGQSISHPDNISSHALKTKVICAGNVDEISRFAALSKVIGHWIRNIRTRRCSREEAWEAICDHNAAMISPPWEEDRLQNEFVRLLKRDAINHGPISEFPRGIVADDSKQSGAVDLSEDALAAAFTEQEHPYWRHVPAWGSWFGWDGATWVRDEPGLVRERARQVCRSFAGTTDKPHEARKISSDRSISAVLRIAGTDPVIATKVAAWDTDTMLLNTPSGVVDLKSGELLKHDSSRLITQQTNASPGSACPRWLAFLATITRGDTELQSYLARLAGYCLTGLTSEQMFSFFLGPGANGKSVFIQTLGGVMGTYAATATLGTFMASQTDRHLTELAGLRASRLVLVPETESGRSWAEGRIKTITGGERIRANFMHRDHFEFTPQFKLIVAGNHRPTLNGVGEAMRRRLHLVPFDVTIPPEKRDRDLAAKLMAERDGILGWMLEGCSEWLSSGLRPPPAVTAASNAYFEEEDTIGQWITERCNCADTQQATSQTLFASWSGWASEGGYPGGSQKSLGDALRERGFIPAKVRGARGWKGIAPKGPTNRGPEQ